MLSSLFRSTPRPDPRALVKRAEAGEIVVLDVREASEIAATGKATVAHHVPMATLRMKADPRSPDCLPALKQGKPVAIYCAAGGRAGMAKGVLEQLGHAEVHNLGGFGDWQAAGGKTGR